MAQLHTYIEDDTEHDNQEGVVSETDTGHYRAHSGSLVAAAVVAAESLHWTVAPESAPIWDIVALATAATWLPLALVAIFTAQPIGSSLEANRAAIRGWWNRIHQLSSIFQFSKVVRG